MHLAAELIVGQLCCSYCAAWQLMRSTPRQAAATSKHRACCSSGPPLSLLAATAQRLPEEPAAVCREHQRKLAQAQAQVGNVGLGSKVLSPRCCLVGCGR